MFPEMRRRHLRHAGGFPLPREALREAVKGGGLALAFARGLGEFGATLLLARPDYPTIPIAIYRFLSQPGALNYGQAMAMATLLMALTTAGILLIEKGSLPGTENLF